MRPIDILRFQLTGSFTQIRERGASMSDEEWRGRGIAGTSRPGFVLWHCARTLDWALHRAAAGRTEVAERPAWRGRLAMEDGLFGAGISDAIADTIPARVDRGTVLDYLDDVRGSTFSWLDGLTDADLERTTDLMEAAHSSAAYRRPEVWAEIESLSGIPLWQLLARPTIGHIRVHLGEVDALLAALRASASA
jgi:hypothetical protein